MGVGHHRRVLDLNLPQLTAGDIFFATTACSEGALNYVGFSGPDRIGSFATQFGRVKGLGNRAFYQFSDIVYNETSGGFDSTWVWSVTGLPRHCWTPALRSAVMGSAHVNAPDSAFAFHNGFVNFDIWQVSANTVWSLVHMLDIAVEVVYSKVKANQNLAIGLWRFNGCGVWRPSHHVVVLKRVSSTMSFKVGDKRASRARGALIIVGPTI